MKTPNTKEFLFASWAIDHKTVVYVIMAIFLILGISSYFNMPRETFPEINDTIGLDQTRLHIFDRLDGAAHGIDQRQASTARMHTPTPMRGPV